MPDQQQRHQQLVREFETLIQMAIDRGIPYTSPIDNPDLAEDPVLIHEIGTLRWLLRTPISTR